MEKYLTPKEVAERFKLSAFIIRQWLREGRIPGFKVGDRFGKGEWRIAEKDLILLQTKKPKNLNKKGKFDILGEDDEK